MNCRKANLFDSNFFLQICRSNNSYLIHLNFIAMNEMTDNKNYKAFLAEIKEKVNQSQYEAMKQVNKALITLYWN
jgi:hypothetical protein